MQRPALPCVGADTGRVDEMVTGALGTCRGASTKLFEIAMVSSRLSTACGLCSVSTKHVHRLRRAGVHGSAGACEHAHVLAGGEGRGWWGRSERGWAGRWVGWLPLLWDEDHVSGPDFALPQRAVSEACRKPGRVCAAGADRAQGCDVVTIDTICLLSPIWKVRIPPIFWRYH